MKSKPEHHQKIYDNLSQRLQGYIDSLDEVDDNETARLFLQGRTKRTLLKSLKNNAKGTQSDKDIEDFVESNYHVIVESGYEKTLVCSLKIRPMVKKGKLKDYLDGMVLTAPSQPTESIVRPAKVKKKSLRVIGKDEEVPLVKGSSGNNGNSSKRVSRNLTRKVNEVLKEIDFHPSRKHCVYILPLDINGVHYWKVGETKGHSKSRARRIVADLLHQGYTITAGKIFYIWAMNDSIKVEQYILKSGQKGQKRIAIEGVSTEFIRKPSYSPYMLKEKLIKLNRWNIF